MKGLRGGVGVGVAGAMSKDGRPPAAANCDNLFEQYVPPCTSLCACDVCKALLSLSLSLSFSLSCVCVCVCVCMRC